MSGKWKEIGSGDGMLGSLIPGVHYRVVENIETGEIRKVYVGISQTTGEAIEKGQFVKDE